MIKKVNGLIIGGCFEIPNSDVPAKQLYYRLAKNHLSPRYDVFFSLTEKLYSQSYSAAIIDWLNSKKKKVDFIVIRVRPFEVLGRTRFLIRNSGKLQINPYVYGGFYPEYRNEVANKKSVLSGVGKQSWANKLNLWLGKRFGAYKQSLLDLENDLENAKKFCDKAGIELVIIGMPYFNSKIDYTDSAITRCTLSDFEFYHYSNNDHVSLGYKLYLWILKIMTQKEKENGN